MICPSCKKELEDGALFCKHCGSDVTPTGTIRCPSCNGLLERGVQFCKYCGVSLVNPSSEPATISCPVCMKSISSGVGFCRHCGAKLSGGNVNLDPYETLTETTSLNTEYNHPTEFTPPPRPDSYPGGGASGGFINPSFSGGPVGGTPASTPEKSESTNKFFKMAEDL